VLAQGACDVAHRKLGALLPSRFPDDMTAKDEPPVSPRVAETARTPTPPTAIPARERRRRQVGWRTADVMRAAAAVIGMYLVIRLIWVAQTVFLTAFLGILFGLAVSAGVDWLRVRIRLPRGVLAAIIVLGSAGAVVEFFVISGPVLATQSRELRTKLPEAIDKIDSWFQARQSGFLGSLVGGRSGSSTAATPSAAQ